MQQAHLRRVAAQRGQGDRRAAQGLEHEQHLDAVAGARPPADERGRDIVELGKESGRERRLARGEPARRRGHPGVAEDEAAQHRVVRRLGAIGGAQGRDLVGRIALQHAGRILALRRVSSCQGDPVGERARILTLPTGQRTWAMRAPLIFSVLLAGAVLIGARVSAQGLDWTPGAAAQATLASGGAYTDVTGEPGGVGLIHAAIDIAAPPQTVWRVMTDCRETPKLITSADPCRILQQGPGWDVREQVTHGSLLVPTIRNVYRSDYQPYSLIRFHKVGGDLLVEQGEWRLQPLNGGRGTRVIYINRVAARIMAPAVLVRAGLRSDTPKVLENLRRESTGR
jgi:hypothetical protein